MSKHTRSRLAWVALMFIFFLGGFAAQTASAYTCQRINATCSINEPYNECLFKTCSSFGCGADGYQACCYHEWGACIDNPRTVSGSQICYGLCG